MHLANDSLILVDKPRAMTSFGVVARLRRCLSQQEGKKVKVGHAGTLDPFATGLLIILTGTSCQQASQFLKLNKVYRATLVLGQSTPSLDPESRSCLLSRQQPSRIHIEAVLSQKLGEQLQRPPVFSAIKVQGRRAYDLARQGKSVDLAARPIKIDYIKLLDYNYPRLSIETQVSSGTYIRQLAADIGRDLGVAAYCEKLCRYKIGTYCLAEAQSLSDLGIEA